MKSFPDILTDLIQEFEKRVLNRTGNVVTLSVLEGTNKGGHTNKIKLVLKVPALDKSIPMIEMGFNESQSITRNELYMNVIFELMLMSIGKVYDNIVADLKASQEIAESKEEDAKTEVIEKATQSDIDFIKKSNKGKPSC